MSAAARSTTIVTKATDWREINGARSTAGSESDTNSCWAVCFWPVRTRDQTVPVCVCENYIRLQGVQRESYIARSLSAPISEQGNSDGALDSTTGVMSAHTHQGTPRTYRT